VNQPGRGGEQAAHGPWVGSHMHEHPALGGSDANSDGLHQHWHSHDGDNLHAHPHARGVKSATVPTPALDQLAKSRSLEEDLDGWLAARAGEREQLAAVAAGHDERAAAAWAEAHDLERQRLELIDAGADAVPLRQKIREAQDTAEDAETAAARVRARIAVLDQEVAAGLARRDQTRAVAELGEAVAERDQVLSRTGQRQRDAVAAVRAAAEEFTAALADEMAAIRKADDLTARVARGGSVPVVPLPVTTSLSVPGDLVGREPVALLRAIHEARAGNVRAVAEQLAAAFGYLPQPPPSAEQIAAGQQARAELLERNRLLLRGVKPLPPALQDGSASVSLDEHGNPLRPLRPAYQPQPSDSYRAPMSAWPPPGIKLGSYDG